jgi:hypothetical protein
VLDNACNFIARNPERDDAAVAVAAWRQLSINSSGVAAVLALQTFASYSVDKRRTEISIDAVESFLNSPHLWSALKEDESNADPFGPDNRNGSRPGSRPNSARGNGANGGNGSGGNGNGSLSPRKLANSIMGQKQTPISGNTNRQSTLPILATKNAVLFAKLFEVILASHVDPMKAFAILDSDNDGLLSTQDFIDMLMRLGLPLSQADKDAFMR